MGVKQWVRVNPSIQLENPVTSWWDVLIITVIPVLMAFIYWGLQSAKWFMCNFSFNFYNHPMNVGRIKYSHRHIAFEWQNRDLSFRSR